jgi:hypothetical protein
MSAKEGAERVRRGGVALPRSLRGEGYANKEGEDEEVDLGKILATMLPS